MGIARIYRARWWLLIGRVMASAVITSIFVTMIFVIMAVGAGHAQEGPRRLDPVAVGGAEIHVRLEHGGFALSDAQLRAWIRRSGEVVAAYFGRFPVPELVLSIHTTGGKGTRTGNMRGWGRMPRVNVWLGERSSAADLKRDWIMVHELVHTAFPDVHDRHHWIEEGIAVYVESVARMHAGDLSPSYVWGEFANRMHHGLPKAGDRGLDRTSTWGRTYWGGALFLFLADLEIRRRTGNKASLRGGLRGIVDAGYNARTSAELEEVLTVADAATQTDVLMNLYRQMRHTPVNTDLNAIWRQLGVIVRNKMARFDDQAPEAWLRQAISTP
ncbi:MAG: hypothetical protein GKR94_19705 [Gammaproteobacteria bacterium]|nr:hypothetical protein [Gammaproteobacteria bacterium]